MQRHNNNLDSQEICWQKLGHYEAEFGYDYGHDTEWSEILWEYVRNKDKTSLITFGYS